MRIDRFLSNRPVRIACARVRKSIGGGNVEFYCKEIVEPEDGGEPLAILHRCRTGKPVREPVPVSALSLT